MFLPIICSFVPLLAFVLFYNTSLPNMDNMENGTNKEKKEFSKGIILCAVTLFFCGAVECTMTQWSSSFVEAGLGVSKIVGDLLGMLMFAIMFKL